MRAVRFLALSLLIVCLVLPSAAQQSSTAPRRDVQALAAIQKSVAAMGGAAGFAQIQTVVAQAAVTPAPDVDDPAGTITSEDQFTSQGHEFRDQFQSASVNQTIVSGHGTPAAISNSRTRKLPPHMATFRFASHLPLMVLMATLTNSNCSVEYAGATIIDNKSAVKVHTHIDTDDVQSVLSIQDWYFDAATGLPLRVEYRLPDIQHETYFMPAELEFADFRNVNGLFFPFRIMCHRDGVLRTTISISSLQINIAVLSSDFETVPGVSQ